MNPLFDLTGKTALVTGGARGIGQAICRAMAQSGARVMVSDMDADEAARTAAELSETHPDCASVELDVTQKPSIQAAVDHTLSHFGRIDILVNNAGINTAGERVTIERYSEDDWHKILTVDLDGVFLTSRPVIQHMQETGGGRIINIASVMGIAPARLQCAYVAAKAAVISLTRAMALELAPHGILVNAIAPGSTLTRATEKFIYGKDATYSERAQSLLSHIPLARPGLPEEMASVAVFLAAPASSYVTGTVLPVDGGWTAGYTRDW